MIKRICDCCGEEIVKKDEIFICEFKSEDVYVTLTDKYDLCKNCYLSLQDQLKTKVIKKEIK